MDMSTSKLFNDLEEWRTPKEMLEYFYEKKSIINANGELMKMSRIKKGLFKEFLEEYWPLCCYAQTRFCNERTRLRIVLGNQGYDALIENPDGMQLKFEITGYIDGELEHLNGTLLNETGIGLYRECCEQRSIEFILNNILNAMSKNQKDYSGVNLLFWINIYYYCEVLDISSKPYIELLIKKMREISFSADKVFLLVFNGDNNFNNIVFPIL